MMPSLAHYRLRIVDYFDSLINKIDAFTEAKINTAVDAQSNSLIERLDSNRIRQIECIQDAQKLNLTRLDSIYPKSEIITDCELFHEFCFVVEKWQFLYLIKLNRFLTEQEIDTYKLFLLRIYDNNGHVELHDAAFAFNIRKEILEQPKQISSIRVNKQANSMNKGDCVVQTDMETLFEIDEIMFINVLIDSIQSVAVDFLLNHVQKLSFIFTKETAIENIYSTVSLFSKYTSIKFNIVLGFNLVYLEASPFEQFSNICQIKSLSVKFKSQHLDQPDIFRGLDSLEELYIENTISSIRDDILDCLPSLKLFHLGNLNVPISQTGCFMRNSKQARLLDELSITTTLFDSESISDTFLQSFTKLKRLRLAIFNSSPIKYSFLDCLTELDDIYLNVDQIRLSECCRLRNVSRLVTKKILSPDEPWSQLSTEDSDQEIYYDLEELCNLKELDLAFSDLDLENDLDLFFLANSLPNLQRLILTFNFFKESTISLRFMNNLARFAHLEEIQLDCSNIARLGDNIFAGMKHLKKLNLFQNTIESLSPNTFFGLDQLTQLNLGKNRISKVDATNFDCLPKLKSLDLYGNKLKDLDYKSIFTSQLELEVLVLGLNQIRMEFFENLNKFVELHL